MPAYVTPRRVLAATLIVVATLLAFLLVYVFANSVLYLFVGITLSTALKPLVAKIRNRGVSILASTLLVYALVVSTIIGLVSWALPVVIEQFGKLSEHLPGSYQQLLAELQHSSNALVRRAAQQLPEQFDVGAQPVAATGIWAHVQRALSYGDWLFRGILSVVAIMLIAFYWTLHEERTIRSLQLLLPPPRRESLRDLISTVEAKMGAYVRGQGILCLTVGALDFLAYLIIGLPYALTLGIIAGILEAVPVFGPVLGAVPPLLLALSVDPSKALWVLIAAAGVQQMENYILVPRIMGGALGVNPVTTLLAIAAFGTLLGLPGAVLAIPLAALVQMVLDRVLLDPRAFEPEVPRGRDAASVVRYRARDLAHDVRIYLRHKEDNPSSRHDSIEEAIESISEEIDRRLSTHPFIPGPASFSGGRTK